MNMTPSLPKFSRKLREVAQKYGFPSGYVERLIANVIVANLLEEVALENGSEITIKGGTGTQIRLGPVIGRATSDLDASMKLSRKDAEKLTAKLAGRTWGVIQIANVQLRENKTKRSIPAKYKVQEFWVHLNYGVSKWLKVILEIVTDEFDHERAKSERLLDSTIFEIFNDLELEQPNPVSLMQIELQIAQKIHALTEPGSDRGHDIYDIVMLRRVRQLDIELTSEYVSRTFKIRKGHEWSASFEPTEILRKSYVAQTAEIEAAPEFKEAFAEIQTLLAQIEEFKN